MGTSKVDLVAPATRFVKKQSSKENHHRKGQSGTTDIVKNFPSKFSFNVPVQPVHKEEEEQPEVGEEIECMSKCECCGLMEECTPAYVERMKSTFCGRLVCGLCSEAVKEERKWLGAGTCMEVALGEHMKVCFKFNTFTRQDPAAHLAMAMRQILRRGVELGDTPKPKGRLRQRSGLSRSDTFSARGQRKSTVP